MQRDKIRRHVPWFLNRRRDSVLWLRMTGTRPIVLIWINVLIGLTLALAALSTLDGACREAAASASHRGSVFWVFSISTDACRALATSPPWFLVSGLIAGPSILLTWYWRDQKRRDELLLAREAGAAARYTTAAQLLHSEPLMARINGLFALWDLARESPSHRRTVALTIAAFITTKTTIDDHPYDHDEDITPPPDDVQNAMRILTYPEWSSPSWHDEQDRVHIDLRNRDLTAIDLEAANLDSMNLSFSSMPFAKLRGASMTRARLINTDLRQADLESVILRDGDLTEAVLDRANLSHADLHGATLQGASVSRATFAMANLTNANLTGVDLRGADLTMADLRDAVYGAGTKFPAEFDPIKLGMKDEDWKLHRLRK